MSDQTLSFDAMLNNYATLLIRQGLAVQLGQEVVIDAPVEAQGFVRRVVRAAYEAKAGHVTVNWADDELKRLEYENVELSYFEHTPSWKREQLDSLAEEGACFLSLTGSDPDILSGIDPAKPVAAARARNSECKVFRHGLDFGKNAWCIGGVPVKAWAHKVFPQAESDEEAMSKLWEAILTTSRATGPDPLKTWEEHNKRLSAQKETMNKYRFTSLHYRSANGTDFSVGLPEGHVWGGGAMTMVDGRQFQPNIPTEEVFTSPHHQQASGTVYSTLPLVYQGSTIKDFWFTFKDGAVVDFGAREGAKVIEQILSVDEGARHLGEVALIAKDTPIRQSGLLFYNTLFDENASCHLAIGKGFAECHEQGSTANEDELFELGVNQSHTHVDFMIGADDLEIVGTTSTGEKVSIFKDGLWAI